MKLGMENTYASIGLVTVICGIVLSYADLKAATTANAATMSALQVELIELERDRNNRIAERVKLDRALAEDIGRIKAILERIERRR